MYIVKIFCKKILSLNNTAMYSVPISLFNWSPNQTMALWQLNSPHVVVSVA